MSPFKPDAAGGTIYIAKGLSLFSPIPFLSSHDNLKLHLFANGGVLIGNESTSAPSNHIRTSVGMGLSYRAENCRLEVNLNYPLKSEDSDRLSPIIQLGFGLDFL